MILSTRGHCTQSLVFKRQIILFGMIYYYSTISCHYLQLDTEQPTLQNKKTTALFIKAGVHCTHCTVYSISPWVNFQSFFYK